MKKSWHPMLMKNQEQVWLAQKQALEERRKVEELRKEREEERQLQELQRLQQEKTGKTRVEKLDWLYATPASGSGPNASEMEEYLLGKKRVDKILIADENAKLGASHKNFIAVQNANTARDIAAKIREDPLFAVMQQQQSAMQALRDNPLRLEELQKKTGITLKSKDKKEKKDKKSKRRHDHDEDDERRHRHHRSKDHDSDEHHRRSRSRSRTPPSNERYSRHSRRSPSPAPKHRLRSPSPVRDRRRSRSPSPRYSKRSPMDTRRQSRSRTPPRRRSPESRPHYKDRYSRRDGPSSYHSRRRSPEPSTSSSRRAYDEKDRAARLAAMSTDADAMEVERGHHLAELNARDAAQLAKEEEERKRNARDGIQGGSFLSGQQKRAMDVSLGDKMRQGHRSHVAEKA